MRNIFTIITLIFAFTINAQNFTGKAIYKTSKKNNFKLNDKQNSAMTDAMKEQITARLTKLNQKTYILDFNKNTSSYKEEVALKTPKSNVSSTGVRVVSLFSGAGGTTDVYFKNLKENRFVNQTEISGKRFLVQDILNDFKWELSSETKNIGEYTCYKATFSKDVEKISMNIVNGTSKKTTQKDSIVTTAWYTPQIPISNGPKDYQGLPGLILEINDGTTVMVCTEIILDKSKNAVINEPKKGKKVSLKEYRKIKKKKSDEMLERFKSKKGVDLGNGINVKIGG